MSRILVKHLQQMRHGADICKALVMQALLPPASNAEIAVHAEMLRKLDLSQLPDQFHGMVERLIRVLDAPPATAPPDPSPTVSQIMSVFEPPERSLEHNTPNTGEDSMLSNDPNEWIVRFVFKDPWDPNSPSAPLQDMNSAHLVLARALSEADEEGIVNALTSGTIDWRSADDIRRIAFALGPWRMEARPTESGSLVAVAAVHGIHWLWNALELNKHIHDAIAKSAPIEDFKHAITCALNYPWKGLKQAVVKGLVRVGFRPNVASEDHTLRVELPMRLPHEIRDASGSCCCCASFVPVHHVAS